jgi:hypothetical protein
MPIGSVTETSSEEMFGRSGQFDDLNEVLNDLPLLFGQCLVKNLSNPPPSLECVPVR